MASIHGTVISKRVKEFSRSVARLNFKALGQWAKDIHGRIFEPSVGPPTKVEVTGWSKTDGRGLFPMDRVKVAHSVSVPPKRDSIPISFIHLSSFGSFHATEIGKREKAVSRRDHLINVQAVGNWAKRVRERFFEANAVGPTQVEVTGWLQMDGRGLFANRLELGESRTVTSWVKNAIMMEDDGMKIAKDADLSLVTEWGLALTTLRQKK